MSENSSLALKFAAIALVMHVSVAGLNILLAIFAFA